LPCFEQYCYLTDVKTLVCPHCQTNVPEGANVCVGCGAEVVRGATCRERSRIGLVFVGGAVLLLVIALRAWQVGTGSARLPAPNSDGALFLVFGALALLVLAYITGKTAGRFVRRSQIRFLRAYRHQ
jgi:zinc-ribbon domain